ERDPAVDGIVLGDQDSAARSPRRRCVSQFVIPHARRLQGRHFPTNIRPGKTRSNAPGAARYNRIMWPVVVALFFFQQPPDHVADGMKALENGKYEDAVQSFRKAADADPKDYTAYFHLGLAYSMMNRDSEGIAAYRKTLELHPGLFEAELNAGILLLRQKEPAEALPLLEHTVEQK